MTDELIEAHYGRGTLAAKIDAALIEAGLDPERLEPGDLEAFEDFHTLGRDATVDLAEMVDVHEGDDVLDVGSGIGGPARLLAHRFGARVEGVDLTAEFCDVATSLSQRTGLSEVTTFRQGDATELPFRDSTFDIVWTQHVAMNIENKSKLYSEMRRVVRVGGRLAFFDIMAGPEQPPYYPVPWAEDESISFLEDEATIQTLVEIVGFRIDTWENLSKKAVKFFDKLAKSSAKGSLPPLGLHLVIPDVATKAANLRRNFEENRIELVRCIATAV